MISIWLGVAMFFAFGTAISAYMVQIYTLKSRAEDSVKAASRQDTLLHTIYSSRDDILNQMKISSQSEGIASNTPKENKGIPEEKKKEKPMTKPKNTHADSISGLPIYTDNFTGTPLLSANDKAEIDKALLTFPDRVIEIEMIENSVYSVGIGDLIQDYLIGKNRKAQYLTYSKFQKLSDNLPLHKSSIFADRVGGRLRIFCGSRSAFI